MNIYDRYQIKTMKSKMAIKTKQTQNEKQLL